jgi:hypothetical protein
MKTASLIFAALVCASAALAQGAPPAGTPNTAVPTGAVEALMKEFGLTGGPWSANCSQPESPNNWYGYFETRDGKVTQIYSNTRSVNRYEILEAARVSNERIRVRVRFTNPSNDDLQTLEWVVRGDRVRTFTNISDQRGQIVKDGRVGDGETPWVQRCR